MSEAEDLPGVLSEDATWTAARLARLHQLYYIYRNVSFVPGNGYETVERRNYAITRKYVQARRKRGAALDAAVDEFEFFAWFACVGCTWRCDKK